MSAGFKIAGEVYWGTNGGVEAFVEALADAAGRRFGPTDPLAAFFREEREAFFTGKVVFLDELLVDAAARARFLEVLKWATQELLRGDELTEYGKEWAAACSAWLESRARGNATPGPEEP